MADEPTFAAQMVAKLEALLLANPGVQSISVDGTNTSFVELEARLQQYRAQVARESGTRPRRLSIDLGSFCG
jgi:hypothetical protein